MVRVAGLLELDESGVLVRSVDGLSPRARRSRRSTSASVS